MINSVHEVDPPVDDRCADAVEWRAVEWGLDLPADSPVVQHGLLLGVDVERLDIAAATDATVAWEALIRGAQAEQAKVVAHLARMHGGITPSHDGPDADAPDAVRRSWEKAVLGSRLGIGDGPARSLVATAVALDEQLPAMAEALGAGGVSWQHCANVAREVQPLTGADAGRVERRILADRRQVTAHQYRLRAHALAAELLTAPPEPVTAPTGLRAWNNGFGGVDLAGSFTPEGGRIVGTAVDVLAGRPVPGDDRPVDERRADALVQICTDWLGGRTAPTPDERDPAPRRGRRAAVAVTVHVGLDQLGADAPELPVEIRGGGGLGAGLVDHATARRLTCDGHLAVAGHAPDGRVTAITAPERYPDAALRRLLDARDAGCRWPGCPRGAPSCDAHHVVHHADGGPTTADNLLLLCPWHHHCVHEGRHRLRFDGATLVVVDPQGHRVVAPAPHAVSRSGDEPWLPDVPVRTFAVVAPPDGPSGEQRSPEPHPEPLADEPRAAAVVVPARPRLVRRRAAVRAAGRAGDDLREPVIPQPRAGAFADEPPF